MKTLVPARASSRRGGKLLCVLVAAVALTLLAAAASASAACTPGWRVTKTLPPGKYLTSVSSVSGMAWAVGGSSDPVMPLFMRFDGSRWSEVPPPGRADVAAVYPWLEAADYTVHVNKVLARTGSDVWAVGAIDEDDGDLGITYPVAMRWDGSAWRVVPAASPRVDSGDRSELYDVVALGPDDAWAVGGYARGGDDAGPVTAQPFAIHWDGSRWTLASGTELGDSWGGLRAVARAPGSQTLWSVGYRTADPESLSPTNGPLIERYKSGWAPLPAPGSATLSDVTAIAWNDVWAVGEPAADGSPVTLHYDSARWSVVSTPPPAPGQWRTLTALSAVSANSVWAVGSAGTSGSPSQALMEHWDGTNWSTVPLPITDGGVFDVSMRPSGNGWAIGYAGAGGTAHNVILRHCRA